MNIICLVLDRINIRFSGPYGIGPDLTPGLDQLAGDSAVFDWYFTNSLDLQEIYRHFWSKSSDSASPKQIPPSENSTSCDSTTTEQISDITEQSSGKKSLPELFAEKNYQTVLLTDEPVISKLAEDSLFKEKIVLTEKEVAPFSLEKDETHLFNMFSELGTKINRLRKGEKPFLIWGHLKGFGGIWDFPLSSHDDEEEDLFDSNDIDLTNEKSDPASQFTNDHLSDLLSEKDAVNLNCSENNNDHNGNNDYNNNKNSFDYNQEDSNQNESEPTVNNELYEEKPGLNELPFYKINSEFSGRSGKVFPIELKTKWSDIYKEGIRHLDSLLEGLLIFLEDEKILDDTLFILAGSRGLPLGEHSQIGLSRNYDDQEDLYFETIHQPLVIRFPDRRFETVRVQGICSPTDLYETLREIANKNSEQGLFPLLNETVKQIHSNLVINQKGSDSKNKALITPNWFLIRSENERKITENLNCHTNHAGNSDDTDQTRYELYACPQDRWNVNDVSDRCEETVNELSKILEK